MQRWGAIAAFFCGACLIIVARSDRKPNSATLASTSASSHVDHKFDFGRVEAGRVIEHSFCLKNTTRSPIRFSQFRTGCGCLAVYVDEPAGRRKVAQESEEWVQPDDAIELIVVLNTSSMQGRVSQTAAFLARVDGKERTRSLVVYADIEPPLICEPRHLDLGAVADAQPQDFSFVVIDNRESPGKMPRAVSTSPCLAVDAIERIPDSQPKYLLRGKLTIAHSEIEAVGQIVLLSESGAELSRTVVRARTNRTARFAPPRLVFPSSDRAHPSKSKLSLHAEHPFTLRLLDAPKGIRVSISGSEVDVELIDPFSSLEGIARFSAEFQTGRSEIIHVPITVFNESNLDWRK